MGEQPLAHRRAAASAHGWRPVSRQGARNLHDDGRRCGNLQRRRVAPLEESGDDLVDADDEDLSISIHHERQRIHGSDRGGRTVAWHVGRDGHAHGDLASALEHKPCDGTIRFSANNDAVILYHGALYGTLTESIAARSEDVGDGERIRTATASVFIGYLIRRSGVEWLNETGDRGRMDLEQPAG